MKIGERGFQIQNRGRRNGSRQTRLRRRIVQLIQVVVFCGTQLVLVPILIRNFTGKALGVTTAAVVVTNIAGFALFVLQRA